MAEGIDLVRPNGQYRVLGQYTDHGMADFNPHLITRKQITVRGSWGVSASHYIGYITSLPRLLFEVDLPSMLSGFSFEDSNSALEAFSQGTVMKAALKANAA